MFAFAPFVPVTVRSFNGAALSTSKPTALGTTITMTVAKGDASPSVPFMPKPKGLDESMVGYVGFDPMGLASSMYGVKWMQQAE